MHSIYFIGGGVDYNSGPYDVTFTAGMTNVSFNVTIINDTLLESNETFNLTIMNMLPITHGKINQIEVTIINNGGSSKYVITLIYSEYICTMNT